MEARRSMCRQMAGSDVGSLLYPVSNEREALRRQGLRPKDHSLANIKVIKEMQEAHKAQEAARPKTAPEPFKMARFKDVESAMKKALEEQTRREAMAGNTSNVSQASTQEGRFMRKGDGQRKREQAVQIKRPQTADDSRAESTRVKTKAPMPTKEELHRIEQALLSQRGTPKKDYIRKNAIDAIRGASDEKAPLGHVDANRPSSAVKSRPSSAIDRHDSYGKVPAYLVKRKEEMLEQQAKRNERLKEHPDDCPPGMRLLGEQERDATREELERVRLKLLKALSQLPFVIDTPTLQSKKTTLEEKLFQVEKAASTYSRKRIFVQE